MTDLLIESAHQILTLTFNRPRVMNAFTRETVRECLRVLKDPAIQGQTRVVVFRGAAANFCAGADIRVEKQCTPDEYREFIGEIQDITRVLHDVDAVSIAAIQGYCLGGGCEIACACDLRVASEDAHLGFPEVRIGLTTTSGLTHILPRLIGMSRAKEMMLIGEPVDALTAERYGLVNRVVPRDDFDAAVRTLVAKIIAGAPLAISAQKHLLGAGANGALVTALQSESDAIASMFTTHDAQEGMSAFIEKREPKFSGT